MRKAAILIGCIFLVILFLVIVVLFGVNTQTGQRFITGRVNSYLEQKLNVPFSIDRIGFKIPDWVVLEGIYIPDLKQDTLVAGKRLYVDLDMWNLIRGEVGINAIEAEDIHARIVRNAPDTTFNYQFLLDAFASEEATPSPVDTIASAPMKMRLDAILLKNVFITYKDDAAGLNSSINVPSGKVKFDAFNTSLMKFHPSDIQLDDANVALHTYIPTVTVYEPPVIENPNDSLDIEVGKIAIHNFTWNYQDDVSGLVNGLTLGSLEGRANKIYLKKQFVGLKNIHIDQLSTFVTLKPTTTPPSPATIDTTTATTPGWSVALDELVIKQSNVQYDDELSKPIAKGLDYGHIHLSDITTTLRDLKYTDTAISGDLQGLGFKEKSGLQLINAKTKFNYSPTESYLKGFSLTTPFTSISTDVVLQYSSLQQLTDQMDKVAINLDLQESKIGFKDIQLLAPALQNTPPFSTMLSGHITGQAKATGTIGNLAIEKAIITTGKATRLEVDGKIAGLPNTDVLNLAIRLQDLSSTNEDLTQLVPADLLPTDVRIPDRIALQGNVVGSMKDLAVDALLQSTDGRASLEGKLGNLLQPETLAYNANLTMDSLQLGAILKMPPQQLGSISLAVSADGVGIDPLTMNTSLTGIIKHASIQNYTYNNLQLDGNLANGTANFQAKIDDENIRMQITGHTNLTKEFPDLAVDATLDKLQLQALNLYTQQVGVQGKVKADFASLNPANPLGTLSIQDLTIFDKTTPIPVGTIEAKMSESANGTKSASIQAPFLTANMNGNYSYTDLADVITHEISKYFTLVDSTSSTVTQHEHNASRFRLQAKAFYHPVFKVFAPELTRMDTVSFAARVDNQNDTSMLFRVIAPLIDYDSMHIERVRFGLAGTEEKALIRGSLGTFSTAGFRIRKVALEGDMANNQVQFDFTVKDSLDKKQHGFSGIVAIDDKRYRFGLTKEALLNYIPWQPTNNGIVVYSEEGVQVTNFGIANKKGEQLVINSTADTLNAPIRIQAQNIQIGPLVTMVLQDSTLAKGTLNTDMRIRNYMGDHLIFGGSLDVKDLHFTQIPLGDLSIRATNRDETRIQMLSTLKSENNDLTISGNYLPAEKKPLDLKIDIKKLAAKTIEAFSFGELTQSKGVLTGNLLLKGSTDQPTLDGQVKFDQVAFRVNQLGAIYHIPTSQLAFGGQKINFNDFIVTDNTKQELKVNGNVDLSTIPDVGYNLSINTRNFTALNSTRADNDMFYGKGVVNADLNIKGRGTETIINGDVKLISGSNITVIMPDDASASTGEGIVEFIQPKNQQVSLLSIPTTTDSAETVEAPIISFASEMNLNIEADDKSEFTIVVDELNGDQLKVKGNAQLNTGISPNGQLFLLGLYQLTEGAYDLSLEVLKKQFLIRKGSQLLWTGDPMKADIDITAVYPINADLSQLSAAGKEFGKTPLNVLLKIQGNLTAPVIKFEIEPQSDILSRNVVTKINDNILTQLNNNSSEVNKQAFALLVMNRFISDQSGSSSTAFNAEGIARQSVSQLLSDQLNLLASDLVKGVNLNFDLNSSNESGKARTDLNVGLSKGFLDDRLTIAVGRNFEIENKGKSTSSTEIFDNISVNYALTRDGRYVVRAYRKNQFQTVLEGYVVETGVSFVVTMDYDAFREVFQKNSGLKDEK